MNFARRVFLCATAFGLLVVPPLFFLEGFLGRNFPPEITHPEFYYGFAGAVFSWQLIYLLIAWDPLRYRPLMLLGALCKASFAIAVFTLVALGRTPIGPSLLVLGDVVFTPLFVWAFWVTRNLE
jgi:hypothetical protein